jgi:hypothetical protein
MLNLHRVSPDDEIAKITDAGYDGPSFTFEGALAPPDDPGVCLKLYEHIGPVGFRIQRYSEDLQIRDSDTGSDSRECISSGRFLRRD